MKGPILYYIKGDNPMLTIDTPKEYWQITRYYRNGGCHNVLKYSYEKAFQEYCNM